MMKRRWLAVWGSLFILALVGTVTSKWYAGRLADRKLAALAARVSPYLTFQHGPAVYNLFDGALQVNNIKVWEKRGGNLGTIRQLIVRDLDYQHKVPNYASFTIAGMQIDLAQGKLKPLGDLLHQYGFRSLEVNISLDYRYTAPGKELAVKEISIEGVGLGMVSASMGLSNIEWPLMDNLLASIMALSQTKLVRARIQFSDYALCDRVLEHLIASTRKSRQEVIDTLVQKLAVAIGDQSGAFNSGISQEVSKFLGKPGTLAATVSPDQPLTLASLYSLPVKKWAALLNLDVASQ